MSKSPTVAEPARSAIAARLRALRLGCHMTAAMSANALGIRRFTVWDYEMARSMPSCEVLRRMAWVYRTSTDYILFGGSRPTQRRGDSWHGRDRRRAMGQ